MDRRLDWSPNSREIVCHIISVMLISHCQNVPSRHIWIRRSAYQLVRSTGRAGRLIYSSHIWVDTPCCDVPRGGYGLQVLILRNHFTVHQASPRSKPLLCFRFRSLILAEPVAILSLLLHLRRISPGARGGTGAEVNRPSIHLVCA